MTDYYYLRILAGLIVGLVIVSGIAFNFDLRFLAKAFIIVSIVALIVAGILQIRENQS